jgi:uncharacterized membrane protein
MADPRTPRHVPPFTPGLAVVTAAFLASGVMHLVRPAFFTGIVPHALPRKRDLVVVSGVAELVCAAGLLVPATRRVGGLASAGLLLAVFPANVQMSVDYGRRARRRGDAGSIAAFAGTVVRLPMQWPLIRSALDAARG